MTHTLNLRGRLLSMDRPLVMTIVNATPDSFYAASRAGSADTLRRRLQQMAAYTDIFDVGGCSTRPGADTISPAGEYERLAPVLDMLRALQPDAVISVDTYRADVARRVVEQWDVQIINDIGGGRLDPEMWPAVAAMKTAYVLMHMRGCPATMQQLTDYDDVCADVLASLARDVASLRALGVSDVIVDPGFGFAKTVQQNYALLARLDVLHVLGCPLLVGISRKSMLTKPLGISADDSLDATTAANTLALMKGADILRMHDPRAARHAIEITQLMKAEC